MPNNQSSIREKYRQLRVLRKLQLEKQALRIKAGFLLGSLGAGLYITKNFFPLSYLMEIVLTSTSFLMMTSSAGLFIFNYLQNPLNYTIATSSTQLSSTSNLTSSGNNLAVSNKHAQEVQHLLKRNISEIDRVSRSANVNLAFGSVTTAAAVFFLAYQVVFVKAPDFADMRALLSYYIPRVSIVIFVEVFSFFFLRLYKANLADIKYYQNELTNIEFKLLAMRVAEDIGDTESTKAAIINFLATERNFVLKKDESTIELEKDKIQQQSNQNIADFLKDLVKSKEK